MIVKDEAPTIRKCLDSMRPLIDTWVIVDTGSTDGTQDVIRECLSDLPGVLHERPWKGFDGSRTEAIELARSSADYLLFIDADDEMQVQPGFRMPDLTLDAYRVALHDGPIIHWRPALVSTRLPWRYVGVLHEYIECDTEFSLGVLEGANILSVGGGARLREGGQRQKYLRDAEVLEQGLIKEPENTRYVFYLGQSWRDAGEPEKSLAAYDRRAGMAGFAEETYCSQVYAARLAASLDRPAAEVMDRYLRAHESRPTRAEAIGELARLCRVQNRWPLAYMFAREAARIPRPQDILFVEFSWHEWRALDELAIAAYWVGEYQESLECCERLLSEGKLPDDQRERVSANLDFARRKLGAAYRVVA
ncbi:tetratricopeptide repeat-containing glycosyltransferase [Streptomyces sp. NBC_00503]|uniref:tetratricopeptide repeat-containing glycosyltransferase n=1 Tax=Streptomyces sp. NBC_00503 TaxID=2903659 RepID=UPI002E822DF5|nr:glycosyltransferase [Streptomyces sp. NBC_00503]WUD82363.1 glycosyltransferase [Streptomyces sp. NBC_00503]